MLNTYCPLGAIVSLESIDAAGKFIGQVPIYQTYSDRVDGTRPVIRIGGKSTEHIAGALRVLNLFVCLPIRPESFWTRSM